MEMHDSSLFKQAGAGTGHNGPKAIPPDICSVRTYGGYASGDGVAESWRPAYKLDARYLPEEHRDYVIEYGYAADKTTAVYQYQPICKRRDPRKPQAPSAHTHL